MSKYKIIAIDLDGTLLNNQWQISGANCAAIKRAQDAGIEVVPCTGRGWREARESLKNVEGLTLGVYTTGAVVADIASGKSQDLTVIEPHLALELVDFLRDQPEAVLIYREHNLTDHEYLVTGNGKLTDNTRWWFDAVDAKVHYQAKITAQDLHNVLRVGMVTNQKRVEALGPQIEQHFSGQVQQHSFMATNYDNGQGNISVYVIEIFAASVNKWNGLSWIASQRGVTADQIVTIGDQINDVPMLKNAGCSIAMDNGAEQAKQSARYITRPNHQDGVAYAINKIIDKQWG